MPRILLLLALLGLGALGGGVSAALIAPAEVQSAAPPQGESAPGEGRAVPPDDAAGEGQPGAASSTLPPPDRSKTQRGGGDALGGSSGHGGGGPAQASTRHEQPGYGSGARSFIAVGRQLIIPVVRGRNTRALILFELAVDVPAAISEATHKMLPRLRDAFLRELFAMSYTGAFDETYTDGRVLDEMRRNLRLAARRVLGDEVADVLVLDVMRQEL